MKIMMNIMSEMMMEFMQNVSKMKKIIITTTMIQYQQKQLVSMAYHYICHVMTFKISILLIYLFKKSQNCGLTQLVCPHGYITSSEYT